MKRKASKYESSGHVFTQSSGIPVCRQHFIQYAAHEINAKLCSREQLNQHWSYRSIIHHTDLWYYLRDAEICEHCTQRND